MIPGIPKADSQQFLELIRAHHHVQKVVLYDLLLSWNVDLQLRHLIAHEGLLAHIERAVQVALGTVSERKGSLANSLINPPKAGGKGRPRVAIGRDQNKLLELCLSCKHAIKRVAMDLTKGARR